MSWFGWKKKKSCCCNCNGLQEKMSAPQTAGNSRGIKILGGGCSKCHQLEQAAREAVAELGIEMQIEPVTDFAAIAACGVMTTPALVIDGKVVSYGKVLTKDEIIKLLEKGQE